MKRILFLLITFIIVSCVPTRQLNIVTNTSDVLYLGVDNPIVIKGKNLTKAMVSTNNGTIKELKEFSNDTVKTFVIKVDNHNPTFIKIVNGKNNITLKYRNKKIPDPEICITTDSARITSCSISQQKFRTATGLGAIISNFDYRITTQIISYKLTVIKKEKDPASYFVKGNIVRDYTKFADSSDIFIFHDILMEFIETKEQRILSGPTVFIK